MANRVAVTGFGAVCALGNSVHDITEALRVGRSGVRLVAADPAGPPSAAGCPLLEGAYADLCVSDRALFDPVTRYAMHAAREALDQSGLLFDRGACAVVARPACARAPAAAPRYRTGTGVVVDRQ